MSRCPSACPVASWQARPWEHRETTSYKNQKNRRWCSPAVGLRQWSLQWRLSLGMNEAISLLSWGGSFEPWPAQATWRHLHLCPSGTFLLLAEPQLLRPALPKEVCRAEAWKSSVSVTHTLQLAACSGSVVRQWSAEHARVPGFYSQQENHPEFSTSRHSLPERAAHATKA